MICPPCRDNDHTGCANILLDPLRFAVDAGTGLWCDCQHRERDAAKH